MNENFFQSAKENVLQFWNQVKSLFDMETLSPYLENAMQNPLATGIAILALLGIPYALTKIRKTNTEAGKRLDKLIEELEEFEGMQASLKEKATSETQAEKENAAEEIKMAPAKAVDQKIPEPKPPAETPAEIPPLIPVMVANDTAPPSETVSPISEPETLASDLKEESNGTVELPPNHDATKEVVDLDLSDAMGEEHDWAKISNPTVAPLREEDFDAKDFEKFQQQMERTIQNVSERIQERSESKNPEPAEGPIEDLESTAATSDALSDMDTAEIEEPPPLEKEDEILMDELDTPAPVEFAKSENELLEEETFEILETKIENTIESASEQLNGIPKNEVAASPIENDEPSRSHAEAEEGSETGYVFSEIEDDTPEVADNSTFLNDLEGEPFAADDSIDPQLPFDDKQLEEIQMEIEKTNDSLELTSKSEDTPLKTTENPDVSLEEDKREKVQAEDASPDFFDGEDLFDVKGLEDIQEEIEKTIHKISEDLPPVSNEEEFQFPDFEEDSAPLAADTEDAMTSDTEVDSTEEVSHSPEFFPSIQPLTDEIDLKEEVKNKENSSITSQNEILIHRLTTFQDLLVKRFKNEDQDDSGHLKDPNLKVYSADEMNPEDTPNQGKDQDEKHLDLLESLVIQKNPKHQSDRIQLP